MRKYKEHEIDRHIAERIEKQNPTREIEIVDIEEPIE
jgi:hypothetical protein